MTAVSAFSAARRGSREGREVAPGAELGDAEIHRPGTGLPGALAVAVALVGADGGALAVGRPVRPSTSSSISR